MVPKPDALGIEMIRYFMFLWVRSICQILNSGIWVYFVVVAFSILALGMMLGKVF